METCFNYCDKEQAYFSSDELKWINRIRKLQEEYPNDIHVIAEPETNDGCLYVRLPSSWLKVQPKREGRKLTEEERKAAVERLAAYRQQQSK